MKLILLVLLCSTLVVAIEDKPTEKATEKSTEKPTESPTKVPETVRIFYKIF